MKHVRIINRNTFNKIAGRGATSNSNVKAFKDKMLSLRASKAPFGIYLGKNGPHTVSFIKIRNFTLSDCFLFGDMSFLWSLEEHTNNF